MKSNVLARGSVRREITEHFVFAELYTDRKTDADRENERLLRDVYGSAALPLYLVLDSEGRETARLAGTTSVEKFAEFLRRGRGER